MTGFPSPACLIPFLRSSGEATYFGKPGSAISYSRWMEHVRSGGSRGGVYLRDLRYRAADAQHRVKAAPELLKKSTGFLKCESEEDRKYGRGFYETVASDLNYKQRFIHSFKCVYMLKDYPIFKESDFEYLRGKIQRQTKRRFTYENCGYL